MKLLFVLVDALKSNYLTKDNMPFLWSLSKKGKYVKQIVPSAGYCERSEIFTGLDGYDTGNFTAIGYLPELSPYADKKTILSLLEFMSFFSNTRARYMGHILRKKLNISLNPYRIPFKSLSKYVLTEDGDIKFLNFSTIFESLQKVGKTFSLDYFTSLSDINSKCNNSHFDLLYSQISQNTDFIPLYIGVIDEVGHKYGNDIVSIQKHLRDVDLVLKELYDISIENEYVFSVLGDHGMVQVNKSVDFMTSLLNTSLKMHNDYEIFLDSTIARFWFYNNKSEEMCRNIITNNFYDDGIIVDKFNYMDYRIPLDIKGKTGKPIYGDIVWCANPGVLISPDFFHSSEVKTKGMHGYLKTINGEGTGLYVSTYPSNYVIESLKLSQICDELCNILEVEQPNQNYKRKHL